MDDALTNAEAVIDALGGNVEVAKITSRKDSGVVWNWRKAGKLPSDTFLVLSAELESRGLAAPASLWGIVDPGAENGAR